MRVGGIFFRWMILMMIILYIMGFVYQKLYLNYVSDGIQELFQSSYMLVIFRFLRRKYRILMIFNLLCLFQRVYEMIDLDKIIDLVFKVVIQVDVDFYVGVI